MDVNGLCYQHVNQDQTLPVEGVAVVHRPLRSPFSPSEQSAVPVAGAPAPLTRGDTMKSSSSSVVDSSGGRGGRGGGNDNNAPPPAVASGFCFEGNAEDTIRT